MENHEIVEEDLSAIEAGFNDSDDEPDEAIPEVKEEVKPDTAVVEPEPEPEKPLTRAELQAVEARAAALEAQLKRVHDTAFGKMGDLQKRIDQAAAVKASGLSPNAQKKLAENFPELAEMLFGDAAEQEVAQRIEPEKPVVTPQIDKEELERSFEKRLLKRDHPDWESQVKSTDFQKWVTTLPADEQQTLSSTWDADFISGKLTAFKEHKKAAEEKITELARKEEAKKKRLEAAIIPKGRGNAQPIIDDDEAAAMEAAFFE